MGLGLPHHARWYRPGGSPFVSPARRTCRGMEGILMRKCYLIFPGWRWLHEPQPFSDQPVALGSPQRAWRYRPGGPPFSSAARRGCRGTEGVFIRKWGLVLLALGLRFPANQPSARGLGLSTPCAAVSTRGITVFGLRFRPNLKTCLTIRLSPFFRERHVFLAVSRLGTP